MRVVAAHPERHRRRRVVNVHGAHVGAARHQIFDDLAAFRIKTYHAVGTHAAGPELTVPVGLCAVGVRPRRQVVFGELLRPSVEQCDLITRYSAIRMRSWSSISMRRARPWGDGNGNQVTFSVFASILPR